MEEQGLVVVKDNILIRVTKSIRKFFFKGKLKNTIYGENKINDTVKFKLIQNDMEFVQEEILNARKAFRKYVICNKNASNEVFSLVKEKIQDSEHEIKRLIDINGDEISFESILKLLENEQENIAQFKCKNKENGRYSVPIGVIGVECDTPLECINNIFKAISTRNSIIILKEKNSQYSTESLILLIVKKCLKNFSIDSNIIQMFEKTEIDMRQLDKVIKKENEVKAGVGSKSNTIYIYQENDDFEQDVKNEFERLKNSEEYRSYDVQLIKGEFGDIIQFLNKNGALASCMYTSSVQKAYKFINWINCPNLFVNTGVQSCERDLCGDSEYFNCKYVLHKGVF